MIRLETFMGIAQASFDRFQPGYFIPTGYRSVVGVLRVPRSTLVRIFRRAGGTHFVVVSEGVGIASVVRCSHSDAVRASSRSVDRISV
jgi:hypothetical protein